MEVPAAAGGSACHGSALALYPDSREGAWGARGRGGPLLGKAKRVSHARRVGGRKLSHECFLFLMATTSELSVPFPSPLLARIALGSLAPDPEPRKGGISKELKVTEDVLHVWIADEARILRVSISSFLEHLSLVVETMDMFGPPVGLVDSSA
uniref:L antigen family member 3 n=1 Tax=Salvator merianae TaxID=96440 RepID=A0A8D0B7N0_SALMN